MDGSMSRFVGMLLAVVLSGAAEPVVLLAQQAPGTTPPSAQAPAGNTQTQAPNTQAPSPNSQTQAPATQSQAPGSATPAAPNQTSPATTQEPSIERQQQEDKASQDLINGNRENGAQLPESPDTTRIRDEAAQKAAQQQSQPGQPSGTAVAPAAAISGSVASRPAGAAIAPAKQRQVRSLLIKLGIVAGAGVALGTVYALTRGSSSTPPGAR
jgi:hypothetical protein